MPEDAPKSPALAFPPTIDPAKWEDFPTFRETFLLEYTNPDYNAVLRRIGAMLFEIALEAIDSPVFPSLPGRFIRHELKAAAGDLRHMQGFLVEVAGELEDADAYDPEDADLRRLARLAGRLAVRVGKIADAIERALAPREGA